MKMYYWKCVSLIYDLDDRGLFNGYDYFLGFVFINYFKKFLGFEVKFEILILKYVDIFMDMVGNKFFGMLLYFEFE